VQQHINNQLPSQLVLTQYTFRQVFSKTSVEASLSSTLETWSQLINRAQLLLS